MVNRNFCGFKESDLRSVTIGDTIVMVGDRFDSQYGEHVIASINQTIISTPVGHF